MSKLAGSGGTIFLQTDDGAARWEYNGFVSAQWYTAGSVTVGGSLTVNGSLTPATLSGTIAGSPTFSGTVTFTTADITTGNITTANLTSATITNAAVLTGGVSGGKSGTASHSSGTWSLTFTNGILTAFTA